MNEVPLLQQLIAREVWPEALTVSLSAWRRTRATELAALVSWLGDRVESPEVVGTTGADFHAEWCRRAKSDGAASLGTLLATLTKKAPEGAPGSEWSAAGFAAWKPGLSERLPKLEVLHLGARVRGGEHRKQLDARKLSHVKLLEDG